jgi:receptor-type tyrosine-protein phosphatase R
VFIGAEIGMQQLDEKGEVDILKIVSTLRQDRGGMVQTKDQYLFLYQVSFVPILKQSVW